MPVDVFVCVCNTKYVCEYVYCIVCMRMLIYGCLCECLCVCVCVYKCITGFIDLCMCVCLCVFVSIVNLILICSFLPGNILIKHPN